MFTENTATDYKGFDFLKLDNLMTDQQRATRQRVQEYVQKVVLPNINQYWDKAEFPREMAMSLKNLGIVGGLIRGHGSAGLDPI